MRKLLSIFSICLLSICMYAQDKGNLRELCGDMEEKKLFECYRESGYYTVDHNYIIVSNIVEDLGVDKTEIYNRLKMYLNRSDNQANWIMMQDNPDDGLVVAKGVYSTIGSHGYGVWNYKVYYTLRVDMKDNRARLVCTATQVAINNTVDDKVPERMCELIEYLPLGSKRVSYNTIDDQYKAFNALIENMNKTIFRLGVTLQKGSLLTREYADW